jgi:hypothetical protein
MSSESDTPSFADIRNIIYVTGGTLHVPFVFVVLTPRPLSENWLTGAAVAVLWGAAWMPLDAFGGIPILGGAYARWKCRREDDRNTRWNDGW